jgi:hypothetical protein
MVWDGIPVREEFVEGAGFDNGSGEDMRSCVGIVRSVTSERHRRESSWTEGGSYRRVKAILTGVGALLQNDDADILTLVPFQLLEANGSAQPRRSCADDTDVDLVRRSLNVVPSSTGGTEKTTASRARQVTK